jgi:hypothetical protein
MTSALIQCPFCGSLTAPKVTDNVSLGYAEHIEAFAYAVVCSAAVGGCGATCGFQETEDDAIEAWNKRCEE